MNSMFGKRRKNEPLPAPHDDGSPWENETIKKLRSSDSLTLIITHLENRFRAKTSSHNCDKLTENEVIATGTVPYFFSQYIHVNIEFDTDMKEFGFLSTDYQMGMNYRGTGVHLPVINVILRDDGSEIQSALISAMQQAVLSGKKYINVKLLLSVPNSGDRDEPEFFRDVTGFYIWSSLHSPQIRSWQLPIGEMSLDDFNSRASQLRKSEK